MTLSEFKAWFEGYTEGLEAAPTKAQFDRIKEKVKEIDGAPITYPVFVDRHYYPQRYDWRYPYVSYAQTLSGGVGNVSYAPNYGDKGDSVTKTFDSVQAMYAAGKAEAMN